MLTGNYDGWNSHVQTDPPTLHLPIAVPGSGKSRLASNLVISGEIVETAIVSPDEIREWMTDDRSNQDVNAAVFAVVDRVIDARMKNKRDIYLDATNLTKKDREKLFQKATGNGYEIVVYLWNTPKDVILKRNKSRQWSVPDHVMDKMFARIANIEADLAPWNVKIEVIEKVYKGEADNEAQKCKDTVVVVGDKKYKLVPLEDS